MKIAIISAGILPVPPVNGGAVETLIDVFLKENELAETSASVDVYSIKPKDGIKDSVYKNCNFVFYNSQFLNYIKGKKIEKLYYKQNFLNVFLEFVQKKIKNKNYDYIIIENRPQFVKKIAAASKAKIILHMHNEHITNSYTDYSFLNKSCHKILVVSQYIKNVTVKKYPILENKINVLHNGININRFDKNLYKGQKKEIRKNLGIKEKDFVICFVGRVKQEKGILELIRAFNLIAPKHKNIVLLIIGSSWFGETNEKDSYVKKVKDESEKYKDRIMFTGYIDNSKVAIYESIADLVAIPSLWDDPFPLVILEAEALDVPILTTDSGGIPEMCGPNEGYIVNRSDKIVEDISKGIVFCYQNIALSKEKSQKACNKVLNEFTTTHYYNNFIQELKD